jgi:hypothetical protein
MPTDPKSGERETEVSKWLYANDADQFKEAFAKQGYADLEDVTDAVIDQIVGSDGKMPGLGCPPEARPAERT